MCPLKSTFFPYTTLFRSSPRLRFDQIQAFGLTASRKSSHRITEPQKDRSSFGKIVLSEIRKKRSEEHTSELQSRRDLVCRLLLEKKKYMFFFQNSSISSV